MDEYMQKIHKQCIAYAQKQYIPCDRNDVEPEDVAGEMLVIVWRSWVNGNGITPIIQERKLIPTWQLRLIFLNALRNLGILQKQHIEIETDTKAVWRNDIYDFWRSSSDDTEPEIPDKEMWLSEIRRLKENGYTDDEIVEIIRRQMNSNITQLTLF